MKKSIWLAIIGAAALTGCRTEVMQQREYIPLPRDDSEATRQINDPAPAPEVVQPRQDQPVVQELPTMTQTFSDEGISDEKYAGKKSGKRGAKGGKTADKGGKAETKGGEAAPRDANGRRIYTVRANDNPEKIAKKLDVDLDALMDANNLDRESAKRLQIGQKLVIPEGGKAATKGKGGRSGRSSGNAGSVDRGQKRGPAPAKGIEVDNGYIVKVSEDMSIGEFASEHNTTVAKLRELNDEIPDELKEGASYVVPKK